MASDAPVLVTGAAGFVGHALLPALLAAGHRVVGVHRPDLPRGSSDVEWAGCDLRERADVDALLGGVQPGAVIHLAAIALPALASRDPGEALRTNYVAVDHLVRGLAAHAPAARLLYVSTGEVYGPRTEAEPPACEDDALAPPNAYAATKAAAEQRVALGVERDGIDAIRVRPFNHTGPGRPADYAESAFARQIAQRERGGEPVVRVGNLDAVRDYCDVRDVVAAYVLLLERGERGGVYNVCSGQPRTVRSILDHLLSRARRPLEVERDPARYRPIPGGRSCGVGDPERIRALGWSPAHALESTLDALLEDWRARV